jgi:RNA polymerase sigma-70 factor (ECF subfamily)
MVRRRAGEDEALIEALKCGDDSAFNELVARYRSMVFSLCLRLTGDPDDADDCAQETFVKLYRSIRTFKGNSQFSTWLYRIAYNTSLDGLRSRKRLMSYLSSISPDSSAGFDPADSRSDFSFKIFRDDEEREVMKALDLLNVEFRAAVVLCDIEGKSYEEAADVIGCAVGTVKSRLFRARERLRGILGVHDEMH